MDAAGYTAKIISYYLIGTRGHHAIRTYLDTHTREGIDVGTKGDFRALSNNDFGGHESCGTARNPSHRAGTSTMQHAQSEISQFGDAMTVD